MKNNVFAPLKVGFFCCFLLFFAFAVTAQTEGDIKSSGNYFWGQSIDDTEEDARLGARDDLMYVISDELSVVIALDPNYNVLVGGIRYMSFPRGPRTRVLAYILKENVTRIKEDKKLHIVELVYEEHKEEKPKEEKDEAFADNKENIHTENEDPASYEEETIQAGLNHNTHKPQKQNEVTKPFENLLDFVVQTNNIAELTETLAEARHKGLVQFGRYTPSMLNPEISYFIVFDPGNGSIIAVLDKGSGSHRQDLKNNQKVNNFLETYKNMNIVWLQIY